VRLPPAESRVVTGEEMAALDREATRGGKITSLSLMERAGKESARAIAAWWKKAVPSAPAGGPVLVLCGRGNNGGDGFVVARVLKTAGFVVRTIVASDEESLSPDARVQYAACAKARVPVTFLPDPGGWGPASEAADAVRHAAFLVDALLGTGSKGAPRGATAAAIELAMAGGKPIAAIDLPSGVDASTGHAETPSIRADFTVTLALPKLGLVVEPGREHAGTVQVVDIGIPPLLVAAGKPGVVIAEAAWVRSLLPRRPAQAHKGSVGRVLIVGGSAGLMGAMALASQSVLRVGAGYAVAAVPKSCVDILEARVSEVVKRGFPETERRSLAASSLNDILMEAMRADVVAIGPGLSRDHEAEELARALVEKADGPIVLDADGLNAFEGQPLRRRHGPLIVTPHYGEASRLSGKSIAEVSRDPVGWARAFAETSGTIVCLKSVPMVTAVQGEPAILNATGNPGMATAGSGDVLTGTIAGLLAQGMDAAEAAAAGCFIHGLAGDIAARRMGRRGLIAGDIRDSLPAALVALESGALDGTE